jgi:hypothetical protein
MGIPAESCSKPVSGYAPMAVVPIPLSRDLLEAVLADQLSDRFVCELVWARLGYQPPADHLPGAASPGADPAPWSAGPATPSDWAAAFPTAPELIAIIPCARFLAGASISTFFFKLSIMSK